MTRHEKIALSNKAVKAILSRLGGQKDAEPRLLAEIIFEKFGMSKADAENLAAKVIPFLDGPEPQNTAILQAVIDAIGAAKWSAGVGDDTAQDFLNWVKSSRIKLPKEARKMREKQLKIGLNVINSKHLSHLDQWWQEASELFPHFLDPDNGNLEDQFCELAEAVDKARGLVKMQITGNAAIDLFGGKDGVFEIWESVMTEYKNGVQVTAYFFGKKLQRTKLVFSGTTKPFKDGIKKIGKAWFNQALARWEVDVTGYQIERLVRAAAMPEAA